MKFYENRMAEEAIWTHTYWNLFQSMLPDTGYNFNKHPFFDIQY